MHTKTTAMATTGSRRSSQEQLSTSRSRRHFHWSSSKVTTTSEEDSIDADSDELQRIKVHLQNQQREDEIAQISKSKSPNSSSSELPQRRKLPAIAVSRIKSVLVTAFSGAGGGHIGRSPHTPRGLGPKVIGTLFGHRKGHVNFVFQREHNSSPVFFVELATPITTLVKEMASGLVRIALECDKPDHHHHNQEETKNSSKSTVSAAGKLRARSRATWGSASSNSKRLLEEPVWRAFCNGKKCGFANKREPGPRELKVLKTVEPISMGAGVLPGFDGAGLSGSDGEMMYMRAKFERVVGSRDSEAFYMMNPDFDGAPELSLYLLRV